MKKNAQKQRQIASVVEQLKKSFPFKNYIETASDCGRDIVMLLSEYLPPGARILDFGAGPCDKTAIYSRMGYKCYACDDLSDDWHNERNNKNIIKNFAQNENIDFLELNDHRLPYPGNFFDAALIVDVIEHLHNSPRQLLNHLVDKIKENGYLLVAVPNAVNLRKRIAVCLGYTNYPKLESFYFSPEPWRGHVREYTLEETKQLLEYQGLEVVYADSIPAMARKRLKNKAIRTLYGTLVKLFPGFADTILVAAKKPPQWKPVDYSKSTHAQYAKSPTRNCK